jgi:hypothetical protein
LNGRIVATEWSPVAVEWGLAELVGADVLRDRPGPPRAWRCGSGVGRENARRGFGVVSGWFCESLCGEVNDRDRSFESIGWRRRSFAGH